MKERLLYLDWLRLFSTFMVVTIHISAPIVGIPYYDAPSSWLGANFYESISRASVPLFVMISGALLLGDHRDISYKGFLSKRVSKIFIPLVCWSFIYYVYQVIDHWYPSFSIKQFISMFLADSISMHFWFMYMILGIYLTTPIIKIFINHAKKRDIEYFLILWFYVSFIVKIMVKYIGLSFNIELFHVTNYIGFFVLGYYLSHFEWKRVGGKMSLLITFIGMSLTFFLTYFFTIKDGGIFHDFWYNYHTFGVLLSAVGTFLLCKHYLSKIKLGALFYSLNRLSFGIYLVHILVMWIFADSVISRLQALFHPILSIPLTVIFVVAVSGLLTIVISKIPIVKKLIP